MDPLLPIPPTSSNPTFQPYSAYVFSSGVYSPEEQSNDLLASLDSDTRDYVIRHTDESRTRNDIIDCVNRLHGKS